LRLLLVLLVLLLLLLLLLLWRCRRSPARRPRTPPRTRRLET
jgi:hypothetical protein